MRVSSLNFFADCLSAQDFLRKYIPNGTCRRCSTVLSGRRTIWCSTSCSRKWWNFFALEHEWKEARKAAVLRDRCCCTVCGSDGRPPKEDLDLLSALFNSILASEKQAGQTNRLARENYFLQLSQLWRSYRLEVNHTVPRLGKGYGMGCHHHLDNLRTMCHSCHTRVTNEQRALRPKKEKRIKKPISVSVKKRRNKAA